MRFKIDWASLIAGIKFTVFALFYSVFEGNFQVQATPRGGDGKLGTFTGFKAELKVKENATPQYFKSRPVPYALKGKVESELKRLV